MAQKLELFPNCVYVFQKNKYDRKMNKEPKLKLKLILHLTLWIPDNIGRYRQHASKLELPHN